MARLLVKNSDVALAEIHLTPGRNVLGREGANDFLVSHASVSRQHCEVWLMEDALIVRDLGSRNGTFVNDARVEESPILTGQTLRLGDVEFLVAEAPVHISVPEIPLHVPHAPQTYMPDGNPCCFHHEGVAATLQCTACQHPFCGKCVRELRVAGGTPRRFCPDCGKTCERIAASTGERKRSKWLEKIVDAFTKPTVRR